MTLFALVLLAVGVGIGGWRMATRGSGRDDALTSLDSAQDAPLRLVPLPLIGFGLQLVALQWAGGAERFVLFTLSQALLLLFFAANLRHAPLRLLSIGFALNLLPMLSNGGYMPITPEAVANLHPGTSAAQWSSGLIRAGSKDIVLTAAEAPFWFLGDLFVLGSPFPLPAAFSLGDILILIGFGWTVYQFSPSLGVNNDKAHRIGTLGQRGSRGQTIQRTALERPAARRRRLSG
jgi:hypothetical protein